MTGFDRRTVLSTGAIAAVGAVGTTASATASAPPAPVFTQRPLPFDPTTIAGLSERLLTSHHQNNYIGAVRRLGQIAQAIAALDLTTTPGFQLNGLKREELLAWNSMILHELYFAGFGQPNRPDTALGAAIERDFGSHERWRAEFSGMGKALGGGSGWVLLTWSGRDRRLMNQWAADHSMTLAGSTPLLALDMYEHSYAMDYGANAAAYVDAYMRAIDWREAGRLYRTVAG